MCNNQTTNDSIIYMTYPKFGEVIESPVTKIKYTIGSEINFGSFGIIYNCSDSWGNDLALKILKPTKTFLAVKSDYQKEIFKLLFFRHPHITYIYDAFEYRNAFYIIMEKCSNTLLKMINVPEMKSEPFLRTIANHILQAIHFIHLGQYVHLDLHLGNIFYTFLKDEITKNDILIFKIGDLGISRPVSSLSPENTKAEWMVPPEMINPNIYGKPDHRVDIYHLGLIFLQLLNKKPLVFPLDQILIGGPFQYAKNLHTPLGDIIANTLHPYVDKRTNSALELWKQLDSVLPKIQ